jgi:hypothetical protein
MKKIISSPLGFVGTTIEFQEISMPTSLEGYISFVGHPATKELLEALGATSVSGKMETPDLGEEYLAVPLRNNTREGGYTQDTAVQDVSELRATLCRRVK